MARRGTQGGRPPLGERALTAAEKQRRYRDKFHQSQSAAAKQAIDAVRRLDARVRELEAECIRLRAELARIRR
jgi:hypothetical protein